ncbi:hypothetical protein Q4595_10550 [Wenyingzhuangia sp. 1_MG-2023]|nr:hypothetical protein [Wenyingzhuangia sp. 1_MG-2023]
MKTKFYYLLTLFFFGNLFFSCQNDDSDTVFNWECPAVLEHFKINGISSQNIEITESEYDILKNINENSVVLWNKFILSYRFETEYIAKRKSINTTGGLMALSCEGSGYNGSKIGVDTLFITTTKNYNENYSAGDTINQIVKISNWNYYYNQEVDNLKSISNYIDTNTERISSETFDIKIMEAPSIDGEHIFEITYKLNNGEVFKHQSSPVQLKK